VNILRIAFVLFAILANPALAIEMCGSGPRENCIVDGDTFWLNGEKYRPMGYDTPEPMTNICGGAVELELAKQASQRLLRLFNETEISIEPNGRDRYDRILAIVRSDGEDVGNILIREGLARSYPDGCEFWCGKC
jgi:endonuclease YncB( thermonuclease family)